MRRTILLVTTIVLLGGCGGSSTIDRNELTGLQDDADDVARRVVSSLVEGLGAAPPAGDILGRGLFAGCDNGDPDEAAYFVDTFVTYDVRPAQQAGDDVVRALGEAGLTDRALETSGSVTLTRGDVTVDLTSQEKSGGSAGQNIFVRTPCLAVGQQQIRDLNARNGRPVSP